MNHHRCDNLLILDGTHDATSPTLTPESLSSFSHNGSGFKPKNAVCRLLQCKNVPNPTRFSTPATEF